MPEKLLVCSWKNIKLITYSAPRAGYKEWAKTLTETKLESEFLPLSIFLLLAFNVAYDKYYVTHKRKIK
jgi:hypothetical protein